MEVARKISQQALDNALVAFARYKIGEIKIFDLEQAMSFEAAKPYPKAVWSSSQSPRWRLAGIASAMKGRTPSHRLVGIASRPSAADPDLSSLEMAAVLYYGRSPGAPLTPAQGWFEPVPGAFVGLC